MLCVLLGALGPIVTTAAQEAETEALFFEDREAIPERYRWNLTDIVPTVEEWEARETRVAAEIEAFPELRGTLGAGLEALAAGLERQYDLARRAGALFVYASQWQHLDTRAPEANQLLGRAQGLMARLGQATAFVTPEILEIPPEQLDAWREHERLEPFDHVLDDIVRTREHVLDAALEDVLAGASLLTAAPGNVYSALTNSDIEWPIIEGEEGEELTVVPAQFYRVVSSQDRRVRREGALSLFATYGQFGNTFAGTYGALVQKDLWLTRTRGYDSTLQRVLDGNNIPPEIVETLVGTVHDNLDALQGYVDLRRRALGIDDLHPYDMYLSLAPEAKIAYTFDEGWALALEFWTETFGEEYAAVAKRALEGRWVDVYTNRGKRGGAYSWGTYDAHPYLLLNWGGTLNDVSTLVHEMGHSIHTWLANQNQPFHDADYSLFVAEVASVASESLFLEWMLARSEDPTERLALLNLAMDGLSGTFLRQIFFHEFEATAHQMAADGKPLTQQALGDVWEDLWKTYYGDSLMIDEEIRAGWARVPHFYRTYYVWVYATSYAAGEAIAARFRDGDETAVEDYLEMLKLGGSVYPMEALQRAGVDMTRPEVVRSVMDRYRALVGQLDQALSSAAP